MGGSYGAEACAPSSTRRWAWKRIPIFPPPLDLRAVRERRPACVATAEETAAMHEDEAPPQQGGPLGSVEAAEDWY